MAHTFVASDGSKHTFPDDASIEDMTSIMDKYEAEHKPQSGLASGSDIAKGGNYMGGFAGPTKITPQAADATVGFLRPIVAGAAGDAAGAAVAPFTGGVGYLPAYGGTYGLVDALMSYLQQKSPSSFGDALKTGVANAGIQKVMGGVINKGFQGAQAFRNANVPEIYNFKPTTSQAANALGAGRLGAVAKAFEDLALKSKEAALDRSAGAGFTEALRLANNEGFQFSRNPQLMKELIQEDMPFGEGSMTPIKITPGQDYQPLRKGKSFQPHTQSTVTPGEPRINDLAESFSKINATIADPKKLEDVLSTAQSNGIGVNLRSKLQGYQFMKIVQDATDDATGRINPTKLYAAWNDPMMQDSYKLLYNSQNRANISQYFKNIAETQDKISSTPVAKKFWLMHGGIGLGLGMLTGATTGSLPASALTGGSYIGAYLGAQQVGKMLTKPETARLLVALAGKEPLGYSDQFAAKVLTKALNGAMLGLIKSDGSVEPVRMEDGKFVPVGQ